MDAVTSKHPFRRALFQAVNFMTIPLAVGLRCIAALEDKFDWKMWEFQNWSYGTHGAGAAYVIYDEVTKLADAEEERAFRETREPLYKRVLKGLMDL